MIGLNRRELDSEERELPDGSSKKCREPTGSDASVKNGAAPGARERARQGTGTFAPPEDGPAPAQVRMYFNNTDLEVRSVDTKEAEALLSSGWGKPVRPGSCVLRWEPE